MHTVHQPTRIIDLAAESPESTLSDVVSQVTQSETRIIVEDQGAPVAAIISAAELQRLSQLDREQDQHFSLIDCVRTAFADIPDDDIEAESDRILTRIRATTNRESFVFCWIRTCSPPALSVKAAHQSD